MRRWRTLVQIEKWLEPAMVVLGLIWLVLLIVEFIWEPAPWLQQVSTGIWIAFLVDFAVRFALAPKKRVFLARNWWTIISLALPAFRVLRMARALRLARATRGLKLVRLLTSTSRGIRSLGAALGARGAGYVAALTVVVILVGAAGMMAFEGTGSTGAFSRFTDALWWTAMVVTTIGPDTWPNTAEGRVLMLLLSIYAVGVFGYLAAALASVLIGGAVRRERSGHDDTIAALALEIRTLREEVAALSEGRRADKSLG
jgi:voltage-gated potassium channel